MTMRNLVTLQEIITSNKSIILGEWPGEMQVSQNNNKPRALRKLLSLASSRLKCKEVEKEPNRKETRTEYVYTAWPWMRSYYHPKNKFKFFLPKTFLNCLRNTHPGKMGICPSVCEISTFLSFWTLANSGVLNSYLLWSKTQSCSHWGLLK